MASNIKLVARHIFEGLTVFAKTGCDTRDGCRGCDASDLCRKAMKLRSEAKEELNKREKPEVSDINQPQKPEADQRKALCEALAGTVSKLHTMMETAMEEESIETVLDISGQIIDCAECIVKLQSGMVGAKMLAELVKCKEEAEAKEA